MHAESDSKLKPNLMYEVRGKVILTEKMRPDVIKLKKELAKKKHR
jgi:hypothetical protein